MAEMLIYIIVMSITPGPNTILSLSNAAAAGLRKGVRLNIGMLVGISIVTAAAYMASGIIYTLIPSADVFLRIPAFVYLVYLAWKTFRKGSIEDGGKTASFSEGLILQLVNIKVYLLALTAIATYIMPESETLLHSVLLSALIPLICFISGLIWAAGGAMLSGIYKRHTRAVCSILALSLLYCAVRIFI